MMPHGHDYPEPDLPDPDGPVDGAVLLDQLRDALTDYVVLPSEEAADAVVLWIAATHAQQAWQHATRLRIGSPTKRCGKSRLLDVIEATCYQPVATVDATIAALFRSINPDDPPTLIVDEADAIWAKKAAEGTEDLRKLLNAGFGRGRYALRCVGPNQEVKRFATYAMAALAGIGDMPDTVTDRAVNIIMRRRGPGEQVKPFRQRRDGPRLNDLRDLLSAWLRGMLPALEAAEPDLPVEDRAADCWEPLLAVADAAAGDWPKRGRAACRALADEAAESDTERSVSLRLLDDLRAVYGDQARMHTETVLTALAEIADAPWADWYGRRLNPRDLANLLRPYGVRAHDVKIDGVNRKGYYRDHLHDAWTRYLPSATPATSATAQVNGVQQVAGSASQALPATSGEALTSPVADVAGVALPPGATAARCACGALWPVASNGARIHYCPSCGRDETPEP